eukprot:511587_1
MNTTNPKLTFSWGCKRSSGLTCKLKLKDQSTAVSCNYCTWENNVLQFYVCTEHKTIICMECCEDEINEQKKSEQSEIENDNDDEYNQYNNDHKIHSNPRKRSQKRGRLGVDKHEHDEPIDEPNKKRRKLDETCMQMNELVKQLVLQHENDYNSKIENLQNMNQKAVNTATKKGKKVKKLKNELMEKEAYILQLKQNIEDLGVQRETLKVKNKNKLDEATNKLRIVS